MIVNPYYIVVGGGGCGSMCVCICVYLCVCVFSTWSRAKTGLYTLRRICSRDSVLLERKLPKLSFPSPGKCRSDCCSMVSGTRRQNVGASEE